MTLPQRFTRRTGPRSRTGRSTRHRALAALALVSVAVAGCGGDDVGSDAPGKSSTTVSTSPYGGGHAAHGGEDGMGGIPASVAQIAELGDGPQVGDSWRIPVGLNICGRFVEAPAGDAVGSVSSLSGGFALVEPVDEAGTGAAATVGDYAESAGVSLSTGTLSLPAAVAPNDIAVGDTDLQLAGATFSTGDTCGDTRAEVQVWVYSAEAVRTGEDIYTVVTDPEAVPFFEPDMALVIALAPESSLPTLPPAAVLGGSGRAEWKG